MTAWFLQYQDTLYYNNARDRLVIKSEHTSHSDYVAIIRRYFTLSVGAFLGTGH